METLFSVIHVVGAVFIVGPMAILPMTGMRAMRSGDVRSVSTLAKSTNIFALLSVVVAVVGFGLVGMADPKYDLSIMTLWVLASIVAYLLAIAVTLFVVVPALRSAADALSSPTSGGAATLSGQYSRVAAGSGVSALLLVAVSVLMVWKP